MTMDLEAILEAGAAGRRGDAADFLVAADYFVGEGRIPEAAAALDRAFGLAPDDAHVIAQRRDMLERMVVREHGLVFRYVPAGSFLMGSSSGEPDERPVHAVRLDGYWISETPISWASYCTLLDWAPPPRGMPQDIEADAYWKERSFYLYEANKIRQRYCQSRFERIGEFVIARSYEDKPMVAVGWAEAEALGRQLSDDRVCYELPSEAEWEKAARVGLIGAPYSWGAAPPDQQRCDCERFGEFVIGEPLQYPANGYGLHGMCGGVWEWTSTIYDALAYRRPGQAPDLSALGDERPMRVLRGGSWSDSAAAVTVSFRHALYGASPEPGWSDAFTPNVGFRLVRRLR